MNRLESHVFKDFHNAFKQHVKTDERFFSEFKSDLKEIKQLVTKTHELVAVQTQKITEHERRLDANDTTNRNLAVGVIIAFLVAFLGWILKK